MGFPPSNAETYYNESDGHCGSGMPHRPHDNMGMPCQGTTLDEADKDVVMTQCGKRADDYDSADDLTINGHYHYLNGSCDDEPPYEMGGPA